MAEEQRSSHAGVRKYFFFVKENVSSDWKDLAFHLGFGQADIDNIVGRNRDDKSRCMDLLEEWLKRNGEKATIEVLMKALAEAGLQSTVDGLRNMKLDSRPDSSSHQKWEPGDEGAEKQPIRTPVLPMEDLFKTSVKKYYELKLTYFKPLIWNDDFTLNLSDSFTQLELVPRRDKQGKMPIDYFGSGHGKKLSCLDDLFNPDVTGRSTAPRCILIEGEAGGGKTTFLSKEALDAVSQKTELGRRYDIVLFIRLREVRDGETIEEIILDQCVSKTKGVNAEFIEELLTTKGCSVLFLLDGYDELRPEARAARCAIPELLSGKMYPNSTIVITSRPSAGVQQYTRPDCHVRIMGFSSGHVQKYLQQYFSVVGRQELTETLVVVLKGNDLLYNLIETPIFLLLVCVLWEEDQDMVSTGTMTGLYSNLLTCLVRRYCQREEVDMPTDGLPVEVADALLQLGKLALEALLRNETMIDFAEAEKENMSWELLLKLGVVSKEMSSSKLHPRKQLNFSHKTMQEFLAGRYVAHAVNENIKNVKRLQLTSISKALALSNLLQFTCGCAPQPAQAVMEELINLSHREFSQLQPEVFKEWYQLPWPIKSALKKSSNTYKQFVLLCLDILNERKELDVLQALSRALPVVIVDSHKNSRQHALKYYLQNIQASSLPDRMILKLSDAEDMESLLFLEQIFPSTVPGLRLDLKLTYVPLGSTSQTGRLVSILKNVPNVRALDLSGTGLTPSSLKELVEGFSHMSLLEELDLTGNYALGDAGMEVLQAGLSSVLQLAVLRLEFVDTMPASMAPSMRHLAGLRKLDISGNTSDQTNVESLTAVLHTFTAMQVLILKHASLSSTSMRTLVPILRQLTGLIKLDISFNAIGDPGLECLADILPNLKAMKVLYLRKTDISDRGMETLVKALRHLVELHVLDVSRNRIGDSGISDLVKALPHMVELQLLNVSFNSIGDSAIVSLVQTLCQSSNLDTEQNPRSDRSLTAAPHVNTILQELHIGGNRGVTGAGLERVVQLISSLPALTYLNIAGAEDTPAHLSDTAAKALAKALPSLPALEGLCLENISMEPAGFQAVVQAVVEHPTLEELGYS